MFFILFILADRVKKYNGPRPTFLIFFPGSIHSSRILKTLSLFASRQKNTYLPNQQIWLNKLYFQISNSKEKKCLTIDTRDVNELGSGENLEHQPTTSKSRPVILIETRVIPILLLILLNGFNQKNCLFLLLKSTLISTSLIKA